MDELTEHEGEIIKVGNDTVPQRADAGSDARTAEFREGDDGHFGSIGLPATAGWYVSAALYWFASLTVLLVDHFSAPETISDTVELLGIGTLAFVPFLVLGARYMASAWWGPHLRMLLPLAVLGVGAATMGDELPSLVLITMFPTLAVAYLHPPKVAIPYCLFAIFNMVGALAIWDDSADKYVRMFFLGGSLAAVVGGLIYAQQRVRRAAELNQRLSVTDPLTGLANVRRLQSRLDYEVKRANNRDGERIVLFAIDLDDFKLVNDRFSYELGDRVLKAVAGELETEMEPGDLLVRRGGDEFAVLTLHREDRHPNDFASRIATAITRARLAVCPELNPEASVTFAEHTPGESAADFLHRIDDHLHDAKLDAHPERAETESFPTAPQSTIDQSTDDESVDSTVPASVALPRMRRRDLNVGWYFMAAGAGVPAAMLAVAAASGLAPDLRGPEFAGCVIGMLLLTAFSTFAGRERLPLRWSNVTLGGSMVLMTLAIAQAEESRQALLELYAIQPPLAIYILGRRNAIPYLIASVFFYSGFLIESDFEGAAARIAMFVGVIGVLSMMLIRGQKTVNAFYRSTAELTIVDPLTGVGNLRALHRRVEDEIDRCRVIGDDLSILVIDLDGFKQVNDRYSHTMGDRVLVESARAIASVVRADELVARRGGDEFAVVCVRENHSDVDALADRIAVAVDEIRSKLTEGIPTGATVRAAHWNGEGDAEAFLRRCDETLHGAKADRDSTLSASG